MENNKYYIEKANQQIHNSLIINQTEENYVEQLNKLLDCNLFPELEKLSREFANKFKNSFHPYNFLALSYFKQNKLEDALAFYKKSIAINENAINLNNLGILYGKTLQFDLALQTFVKANNKNSYDLRILLNLSNAYEATGDLIKCYKIRKKILTKDKNNIDTIIKLYQMSLVSIDDLNSLFKTLTLQNENHPNTIKIMETLAGVMLALGLDNEALSLSIKMLKMEPLNDIRYANIAHFLKTMNRSKEAKGYISSAIKLNPHNGRYWLTLGVIENSFGKFYHAIELYKKAIPLLKNHNKEQCWALNNLANAYLKIGDIKIAYECYEEAIKIYENPLIIQNYLCNIGYWTDDLKIIFDKHRKFRSKFDNFEFKFIEKQKSKSKNKIRIGYLSPDFREHPVSSFLNQLLHHHDKNNFEIFLYSNNEGKPDLVTATFKKKACHWRDVFKKSDQELIKIIQDDNINILVDLCGNFSGGRTTLFGSKPAPIQVSYLGYVTTTGLKSMDYRFTTIEADPDIKEDKYYTEKLIRLPNTFLCYTGTLIYSVQNPPHISSKILTFGSFNNITKLSSKTIEVWSLLLKNIENSRLVLKSSVAADKKVQETLIKKFEKNGIEKNRISCLTKTNTANDHLKMYNLIDIALDTFPFNGATTTVEALWMGLPVMTIKGNSHHGRVSTSILKTLDMNYCVARDKDDFIAKTIDLIKDKDRLSYLRKNLRNQIINSPLCNGKLFAQNIENEYSQMFKKLK